MRKKTSDLWAIFSDTESTVGRACDFPGCPEEGLYRAPKARNRLNDYYFFCLEHVRAYNRSWDYFAGMSESEIESHIRAATTWDRPTWPMAARLKYTEDKLRQEAGRMRGEDGQDDAGSEDGGGPGRDDRRRRASGEQKALAAEMDALAVLDLQPPVDFSKIRAKYKELVKRHHPDANPGDPRAEETLKRINLAYHTLKQAYQTLKNAVER